VAGFWTGPVRPRQPASPAPVRIAKPTPRVSTPPRITHNLPRAAPAPVRIAKPATPSVSPRAMPYTPPPPAAETPFRSFRKRR